MRLSIHHQESQRADNADVSCMPAGHRHMHPMQLPWPCCQSSDMTAAFSEGIEFVAALRPGVLHFRAGELRRITPVQCMTRNALGDTLALLVQRYLLSMTGLELPQQPVADITSVWIGKPLQLLQQSCLMTCTMRLHIYIMTGLLRVVPGSKRACSHIAHLCGTW